MSVFIFYRFADPVLISRNSCVYSFTFTPLSATGKTSQVVARASFDYKRTTTITLTRVNNWWYDTSAYLQRFITFANTCIEDIITITLIRACCKISFIEISSSFLTTHPVIIPLWPIITFCPFGNGIGWILDEYATGACNFNKAISPVKSDLL